MLPRSAQGDRARGPHAHEPREKFVCCQRARGEIGQESSAHMSPERAGGRGRKSLVGKSEPESEGGTSTAGALRAPWGREAEAVVVVALRVQTRIGLM